MKIEGVVTTMISECPFNAFHTTGECRRQVKNIANLSKILKLWKSLPYLESMRNAFK